MILHFLGTMSVLRREVYLLWRNEPVPTKKFSAVENHIFNNIININMYDANEILLISKQIRNFVAKLVEKWKLNHRSSHKFEENNKEWLDGQLLLVCPQTNRGRPDKMFDECSNKTKLSKVSQIVKEIPHSELVVATTSSLYKAGKRSASELVSMANDEGTAKKIKSFLGSNASLPIPYTPDDALALFLDGNYTKHSYKLMQAGAKSRNANIYPTYDTLCIAKKKCYPNGVQFTNYSAQVPLQHMVDHIVIRIVEAHSSRFEFNFSEQSEQNLTAIYKWGCDGSSGHSTYRQDVECDNNNLSDEYLFAVCIVPLQVQKGSEIIWENPQPSSPRFCRPLKILCSKESAELIRSEVASCNDEISKIMPTSIGNLKIHHQFHLTMIDGKAFSALAESSSQVCGICKASPKLMNDIDAVRSLKPKVHLYEFGLSTLHAWIRCFECILHISYRLHIKKWQVRDADKHAVKERKLYVQEGLKRKMSLLADIPMAGCGNTNNGNTARRFFREPKLASEITGVNEELIYRFSVILRSIACGHKIDIESFRQYALQTAELFVTHYSWFYMPCSIHKILIHGADIIKVSPLPIGKMSEEALEARNKDYRNFREHHTRKTSRLNTMEDLMHALWCSSDPLISNLRKPQGNSKKKDVDNDILQLLAEHCVPCISESSSSSESE